ncbi:MAG: diacylglycerol kinase family lipid kinase [Bacteroidales bacterium]|nr:diacylglycerol kinase family lipid kinase [Bacteroidales bacterium]
MHKRSLFILNPISGTRLKKVLKKIMIHKIKNSEMIDIAYTEYGGHATQIIKEQIDHYDIFVAVGGDGTVNEVATALIGTDKKLAIYPTGSGNGFAREMGFKPRIKSLINKINTANAQTIDTLNINGTNCINVAGIGFDAYVAHQFSKAKHRGLIRYALISLKALFTYKAMKVNIHVNDEIIEENIFMLSIANTRQFGNNALIAPQANPSDGLFDLAIIKPFPKIMLIPFGIRLFMGSLKNSKYIKYIKTSVAIIECENDPLGHIDGEAVSFNNPTKIILTSSNLKVLTT